MTRIVQLIVATDVDDDDDRTDNDVRREVEAALGIGYEVTIPGA